MGKHSIFNDFLSALDVRHTSKYSDRQFKALTFRSIFGLSTLLDRYGVKNAAWRVPKKGSLEQIKPPFLAQRNGHFDIVTEVNDDTVHYIYKGIKESKSLSDYENAWTGIVMTAEADRNSEEPGYLRHHILDIAAVALTWIMAGAFLCLIAYLYVTREFYHSAAATVLIAVDLAGLTVTSMLMLKSLNVHSAATDRVCGILQQGGCDHVLAMDASKFFGLFGWAEVGLGYFIVSTSVLLLFPSYIHYLALANLCCLPFTFWSIWYQKFRAHHWCTLCVITQAMLWCQFFCYLAGGFERDFNICSIHPWILLTSYVFAVLILNKIAEVLNNSKQENQ